MEGMGVLGASSFLGDSTGVDGSKPRELDRRSKGVLQLTKKGEYCTLIFLRKHKKLYDYISFLWDFMRPKIA